MINMEDKIKNLVKAIISIAETNPKIIETQSFGGDITETKEIKFNLPVETIEELKKYAYPEPKDKGC